MIYNCLIADDFSIQRNITSKLIAKIPQLNVVGKCEDGLQAAMLIAKQNIDIVFCDIDMPNLSGIGLLRSLKNPPVFIFITGHSGYAVESYDLDVADFILKPLVLDRLIKAVNKATKLVDNKKRDLLNMTGDGDGLSTIETDNYFFIKEGQGVTRLKYANVIFIESLGDFSKIHTLTDHKHIMLSSLRNFEAQLPSNFKRVHKQYIANVDNITTVTSTEALFLNRQSIPVGATYRQTLLDTFMSKGTIKRKKN